jgi:predicted acetyltransferase
MLNRPGQDDQPRRAAVHTGPDGDEGLVVYHAEHSAVRGDSWGVLLQVDDLHAAGLQSLAALWRFVLGVDMVNMVRGWMRPVDEPLELLLADARTCRTTSIGDEAWLRLVDVPVALGARSWAGTDAVLLGVRDSLLPVNAGTYRITSDGVSRVDEPAQLECDVAVLGRLYLGDVAPSVLAATGWLTVHDPGALHAADALFETREVPWSGTFF